MERALNDSLKESIQRLWMIPFGVLLDMAHTLLLALCAHKVWSWYQPWGIPSPGAITWIGVVGLYLLFWKGKSESVSSGDPVADFYTSVGEALGMMLARVVLLGVLYLIWLIVR